MPPVLLHDTLRVTQQGFPTCLNTRSKQSQKDANRSYAKQPHTIHASPLKAMVTVYQTQSPGYENTTYQAYSQGYGKLLPLVTQHLGEEARLLPFTLQGETEMSCIKESRGHYPFTKPSPHRAGKLMPYLKLHQSG